jgi:hypothetical protein
VCGVYKHDVCCACVLVYTVRMCDMNVCMYACMTIRPRQSLWSLPKVPSNLPRASASSDRQVYSLVGRPGCEFWDSEGDAELQGSESLTTSGLP